MLHSSCHLHQCLPHSDANAIATDYPSPYGRFSEDPDWVAFKNDFRQIRNIIGSLAVTLQKIASKIDPAREDEHEEQPEEVHYVADPTLIEEYEEQMKEVHYVVDPELEDEYYRQIESELSEADEDDPEEKHEPMIEEIVVDWLKPIVDASLYGFDHIWSDIEAHYLSSSVLLLYPLIQEVRRAMWVFIYM
ncbi:hypothetical protein Taro_035176 [Colocasia esculenta]|uniref:Uncharacterized protein n=1 Tax=Colocasia esculenta TaxID=4460 RepID=A0A843VZR2_COLES|nr:hypothetical protein [Colocasia esculenta]